MTPDSSGVSEGSEDFECCCKFICCFDGGSFVVSEFDFELFV